MSLNSQAMLLIWNVSVPGTLELVAFLLKDVTSGDSRQGKDNPRIVVNTSGIRFLVAYL